MIHGTVWINLKKNVRWKKRNAKDYIYSMILFMWNFRKDDLEGKKGDNSIETAIRSVISWGLGWAWELTAKRPKGTF